MNLEQKVKTTKFVIDLTRLDSSLSSPSFTALLNDGWEVFSYVPVEDNGPKIILLLKQNANKIQVEKLSMVSIINTLILFSILIILIKQTF